jgi:hypothetical protein
VRWTAYISFMKADKYVRNLVGKLVGKRALERPKYKEK